MALPQTLNFTAKVKWAAYWRNWSRSGPKSKKRKRDDSEDEDDDDSEEFEAKRPRTLNSRQKKLLGQINYNLDED